MSEIYASIMQGLQKAVEDAAGRRELPRKKVGESVIPQNHAGRRGDAINVGNGLPKASFHQEGGGREAAGR